VKNIEMAQSIGTVPNFILIEYTTYIIPKAYAEILLFQCVGVTVKRMFRIFHPQRKYSFKL